LIPILCQALTALRISLNWPLTAQNPSAFFDRKIFHQELTPQTPRIVNDDVWTFNSQVTSQWDSLRHYAYQAEERFYNGVTMADILGAGGGDDVKGGRTTRNGIQAMAEKGIVGRGVLLDYHSWRQRNRPSEFPIDAFKTDPIRLEDLLATAKEQGTEIHFGDILLVRSGYMVSLASKSASEISAQHAVEPSTFIGVEQSEEMLRWIWENFSAVAGDQTTFECWPSLQEWSLHEVLLSGWGCPIGELFDLEKLAENCEKERRWSFFVTSEVCNVPGGVARYACYPYGMSLELIMYWQSTEYISHILGCLFNIWSLFYNLHCEMQTLEDERPGCIDSYIEHFIAYKVGREAH
jgi:hypothetical protein